MSKDSDDFIMEEFSWALKDPTEEKIKALGEVVSIITTKLTEAISEIQENVYNLQNQVESIGAKVSSLERSGVAVAASPAAAAADAPAMAQAPMAKAPPPKAPSGPGGMMGELKALLAARRRKTEGSPG
ncbi:MAG: hypothetical protein ACXADO_05485 [Candidatus Thorarchaeota archaeon]|jgi:hypothetical protein